MINTWSEVGHTDHNLIFSMSELQSNVGACGGVLASVVQ
jgi:hypothetical protein